MTGSNGDRPALSRPHRRSAVIGYPQNTSKSTTDANRSSGSSATLSAAYQSYKSKNPGWSTIIASNHCKSEWIRSAQQRRGLFEGSNCNSIWS